MDLGSERLHAKIIGVLVRGGLRATAIRSSAVCLSPAVFIF
jgi:hypothetical protein